MAVDNRIQTVPGLKHVEDPYKEKHDLSTTHETIQQLLAGGTPSWVKWPREYTSFVQESFAEHKQVSDTMASRYAMEDQDDLTNRPARMVNPMSTRDFVAKLRAYGVKCFTVDNQFPPGTVALWCLPPKQNQRARYICYLQIPAMYEWSVLRLDRHNMPVGEAFRGWRTVLVQLVEKEIMTEYEIHKVFGNPSTGPVFNRYQQSLWEARNKRRYTKEQLAKKDI
jgi:hypothetical protein